MQTWHSASHFASSVQLVPDLPEVSQVHAPLMQLCCVWQVWEPPPAPPARLLVPPPQATASTPIATANTILVSIFIVISSFAGFSANPVWMARLTR